MVKIQIFCICLLVIGYLPMFVNGQFKNKFPAGKDKDYIGGVDRRKFDKYLGKQGFPRNGFVRKTGHTVEHLGRSAYQFGKGDFVKGYGEWQRAKENWANNDHWNIKDNYFKD